MSDVSGVSGSNSKNLFHLLDSEVSEKERVCADLFTAIQNSAVVSCAEHDLRFAMNANRALQLVANLLSKKESNSLLYIPLLQSPKINEPSTPKPSAQSSSPVNEPSTPKPSAQSSSPVSASTPKSNSFTVEAKNTRPDLRKDIMPAMRRLWPGVSENAIRVMVAHMRIEVGSKLESCWNYNFGNVKAGPNEKHVLLNKTWECLPLSQAEKAVTKEPSLARIAVNDRNPGCGTKETVFFSPPHPQTRFKAYDSIDDGLRAFVERHKTYAKDPDYQKALDAADGEAIAMGLHKRHYYTATPEAYATALKAQLPR